MKKQKKVVLLSSTLHKDDKIDDNSGCDAKPEISGLLLLLIMAVQHLNAQDEINQPILSVISDEELASLNPMMMGQSAIPAHEAKTSLLILQEAKQLNPGLHTQFKDNPISDDDTDI